MIRVFAPGTKVCIGGDIDALVVCANVAGEGPDDTNYTVVWWDGRQRRTETLSTYEVEALAESKLIPIGFHGAS
jgi:hypothetical protein